jgi:lambda family phage minor tail protein L
VAKGIKKEIIREISSINQTAIIELFRLYYNYQEDPQAVLHFHGGTNNVRSSIYFDDQEYIPLAVEAEAFEVLGDQRLPRPKLRISNAGLYMSSILRKYKNLNNAKIERRRIFAKYLDDRNFDGGVNPWGMANPNARMPDDKYYISRKLAENKLFVEFELVSSLELENNLIPAREVASRYCGWIYRGLGCQYGSNSANITGDSDSDGQDRPVADINDNLFVIADPAYPGKYKLNPKVFIYGNNGNFNRSNIFSQTDTAGCLRNRGPWRAGESYFIGDYIHIRSKRQDEGRELTANYYQRQNVYFVCRKYITTSSESNSPLFDKESWVKDACSKKLSGCKCRFDNESYESFTTGYDGLNNKPQMPFGGFPGTDLYEY